MTGPGTTAFTRISVTWEAGVTHLTLNRPARRNAIDLGLAQELLRACLLERTADSRCVLLSGAGDHFCVGGDLHAFQAQDDISHHLTEVTSYLHAAISRLAFERSSSVSHNGCRWCPVPRRGRIALAANCGAVHRDQRAGPCGTRLPTPLACTPASAPQR